MATSATSLPKEEHPEVPGNLPSILRVESSSSVSQAADHTRLQHPAAVTWDLIWGYMFWFGVFHVAACLAAVPWFFSWFGLGTLIVTHYLCATIGSSVCFHRMLAHRSFRSPKWLEHVFATFGVCSLQDSPIRWVAVHRRHHQYTDTQEDPHSPLVSFLWGHVEWVVVKNNATSTASFYDKYARDLLRDPYYFFLERNMRWFWVYTAHAALLFLLGFGVGCLWTYDGMSTLMSGLRLGVSVLLWGVALRTVYGWHSTWAVNSLGHLWGYRNYATSDHSTNSMLLGVLSSGEGWHNNHHADPHCAKIGHRWWEIDVGWWTIALLSKIGLASEIVAEPRIGRAVTTAEESAA